MIPRRLLPAERCLVATGKRMVATKIPGVDDEGGVASAPAPPPTRLRRPPRPDFGIFFDIDGVIVRGKNVLPFAPHTFKRLVDDNGKFRVPTVFVTNACNTLRKNKVNAIYCIQQAKF